MNGEDIAEALIWECEKCGRIDRGTLKSLRCADCQAYASRYVKNRSSAF